MFQSSGINHQLVEVLVKLPVSTAIFWPVFFFQGSLDAHHWSEVWDLERQSFVPASCGVCFFLNGPKWTHEKKPGWLGYIGG